jgi:hypothetical protein
MTIGIREPKLNALNAGDTRASVERRLGKRLWRPGSADGLTYDIYQYKAALAAPWWGAASFAFDFFTVGMTELAFSESLKFLPLKQVAVAYDEEDHVRFVSQPWDAPKGTVGPCAATRALLPGASGVPATAVPSPIIDQAGVVSQLAMLDFGSNRVRAIARIDGVKPEGRMVERPPGRYTVSFDGRLGGSNLLIGAHLTAYGDALEVQLLPGRVYRLKHQRFYAPPDTREDVFWIEDVHSGETLQCASP